jgi:hypothetical protein
VYTSFWKTLYTIFIFKFMPERFYTIFPLQANTAQHNITVTSIVYKELLTFPLWPPKYVKMLFIYIFHENKCSLKQFCDMRSYFGCYGTNKKSLAAREPPVTTPDLARPSDSLACGWSNSAADIVRCIKVHNIYTAVLSEDQSRKYGKQSETLGSISATMT